MAELGYYGNYVVLDNVYSTAFQFLYITLANNTADGCYLSNKVCRKLLPKKTKVPPFLQWMLNGLSHQQRSFMCI